MKKTLLFTVALACLRLSSFAQHVPPAVTIVHNLPGGGSDNGSTPVNLCTTQTYSVGVANFGNFICSYSWVSPGGGGVIGTGPEITLNITGTLSLECVVGYDTSSAFCNNVQSVTSNVLTQQVNEPAISGPYQVCSSPENFTLSNLPPSPTITWSTSSDLQIVGGQNTPTVQVEEASAGAATVSASISSTCAGTMPTLNYGTSSGPFTPVGITGMYNGKSLRSNTEYTFSSLNGTDWHVSGGTILDGQGTTTVDVLTATRTINPPANFSIQTREDDACGISGYLILDGYILPGGGGQVVVLAPNPASGTVRLTGLPAGTGTLSEKAITATDLPTVQLINVYDVTGKLRKSVVNPSGALPFQLDVSDLNNGVYFVEMLVGKDIERQKLVVQH